MMLRDAQLEVRTVFLGGSPGCLAAGLLWLTSAAAAGWTSERLAMLILVFGGMLIFPAALLLLRAMGRTTRLSRENPLGALAMQVALTVPLVIPVILAATSSHSGWFYPAFMIVVGAHYLPFVFLYGMPLYGVLAGLMVGGGLAIRAFAPADFAIGGWTTGGLLIAFGVVAWAMARREDRARHLAPGGRPGRSESAGLEGPALGYHADVRAGGGRVG